jgi:plastocyanin
MRLRRRIMPLLLAMVGLAAAATSAPASPAGPAGAATSASAGPAGLAAGAPIRAQLETPPARLLVYAQEWSLWPSRSTLNPGSVIVQLWNRGQDAHDVRIRRLDSHGVMVGRTQGVPVIQSGQLRQATWHLSKGTYELYCSMSGHMKRGMHARLTVR